MQNASGGSMSKVRVYEVAKQLNLDPKSVVALFQAVGINDVRNHMSSVEPEAVERVKRHLEKQRTHDVVEERVRHGVVKRRAVAKPAGPAPAPSSRAIPPAPPSSHSDLGRTTSDHEDHNGHAQAPPAREAKAAEAAPRGRVVTRDRESGRLPPAQASSPAMVEERKSVRDVAPSAPALPAERKSTRRVSTRNVEEQAAEEAPPARADNVEAPATPATDSPVPPAFTQEEARAEVAPRDRESSRFVAAAPQEEVRY